MRLSPHTHLYKDFMLNCKPFKQDDGRFQARVAVFYLGGERTRSQRFLDFEDFDTEAQAVAHAHREGMAWVDQHIAVK